MKRYLFCQNKVLLLLLMLLQTVRTVGTVGVAVLINMLIDVVQTAIAVKSTEPLWNCAMICGIYAIVLGGVIFASERLKAAGIKRIMLDIRQGILQNALNQRFSEYQGKSSAEYITLFDQNLGTFEDNYLKNLISIYDSVAGILIAVVLLLWIDPVIAVISIGAMAIPGLIPKLFGKRLGILQSDIMQIAVSYHAKIKDIFCGFELIKSYQAELQMEKLHNDSSDAFESSRKRMADAMALLYALANTASVAVQFLIMSFTGIFAVKGLISIGSIIAVTQLTGQVISPAFQLSAKISQLKAVRPVCKQIEENLLMKTTQKSEPAMQEMGRTLALDDVSFSYENDSVIDHVSLRFERGKKYVIVGKSGSGKSTLLKLLAGYYNDYSGAVLSEEKNAGQVQAALIHQDLFLFDDTIQNNITLYKSYPDAAVKEACRLAGLEEMLESLEEGLDTKVLENGSRFSGGEKQRIAVARGILYRKSLFLLDEVTSAMDNETTDFIEDSILSLEGVTCIAVTHKLTPGSLKKYDEIIVMEDGKVVEQGSYDSLLALSGAFAKLYSAGMRL